MKITYRKELSIYQPTEMDDFFTIKPLEEDAIIKSKEAISKRSYLRKEISDELVRYNKSIGNDEKAIASAKSLQDDDVYTVVAGQQLGMFGGPSYTILKGISCLILAKKYNAVPIFWLATEDHDIDEINRTYLLDDDGNLKLYHLDFENEASFVEDLTLTDNSREEIKRFIDDAKIDWLEAKEILNKQYVKMTTQYLVKLFYGTGLVFIEPNQLRTYSTFLYVKEVKYQHQIATLLKNSGSQLKKKTGSIPIPIDDKRTNLFYKNDRKARVKIEKNKDLFRIGENSYSESHLIDLIYERPDRFSANVALRPIVQSYLFPTIICVLGPGELNYYRQLSEYFLFHGVAFPWVLPRMSATFVTEKAYAYLEAIRMNPWDSIPKGWNELTAKEDFQAKRKSKEVAKHLSIKLSIPKNSLHYLNNLLYPRKKPQERVLNWLYFQKKSKKNLISELVSIKKYSFTEHAFIFLGEDHD